MYSGLVPQSEFDPVAYANLVVDGAYVVPGDVFADAELGAISRLFRPRATSATTRRWRRLSFLVRSSIRFVAGNFHPLGNQERCQLLRGPVGTAQELPLRVVAANQANQPQYERQHQKNVNESTHRAPSGQA